MMKKILIAIILLGTISLFIVKGPLLQKASDYLVARDNAKYSDVIIVLGGELKGERTKRAVELYEEGYGNRLLFSDGTDLSWRTKAVDEMTALAKKLGVPDEAIFAENESRSTFENAVYTKEILQKNDWKTAVVVTTDWHTKRSKFIFDKVYFGSGIYLTYAPAPDERIASLQDWWKDSEKQQIVLTEWAKLFVYWLKYWNYEEKNEPL